MFENSKFPFRKLKPLKLLFFAAMFVVFAGAASWIVMYLWNTILADLTSIKPISFWKAAGLLVLSKIIFGGFGGRKKRWKNSKSKHWREKWMNMSGEERQEAKSRWKAYCNNKKADGEV
jgi:hypothetical protein